MKTGAAIVAAVLTLVAAQAAFAETYQLAWEPVSAYSDGSALEPGKVVTYAAYWTTDPALSAASLKPLASGVTATGLPFDPVASGMTRGQTVYFACRASLGAGDASELSSGVSWVVPARKPSAPGNTRVIRIK